MGLLETKSSFDPKNYKAYVTLKPRSEELTTTFGNLNVDAIGQIT